MLIDPRPTKYYTFGGYRCEGIDVKELLDRPGLVANTQEEMDALANRMLGLPQFYLIYWLINNNREDAICL